MPTNRDLRKYAAHNEANGMMAGLCRHKAEEALVAMHPATEEESLLVLRAVAALREQRPYLREVTRRAGDILQHHGVERTFQPKRKARTLKLAA